MKESPSFPKLALLRSFFLLTCILFSFFSGVHAIHYFLNVRHSALFAPFVGISGAGNCRPGGQSCGLQGWVASWEASAIYFASLSLNLLIFDVGLLIILSSWNSCDLIAEVTCGTLSRELGLCLGLRKQSGTSWGFLAVPLYELECGATALLTSCTHCTFCIEVIGSEMWSSGCAIQISSASYLLPTIPQLSND